MTGVEAIAANAPVAVRQVDPAIAGQAAAPSPATATFGEMIMRGLHAVDTRVGEADALVRQFAIDETVPVHQVTMALEEARLAVELAMQVRTRLVEGYRELMNMQM